MKVKKKIAVVGPWGSSTGQNWSLKIRGKITKISIHHGNCINSISFTSQDEDANVFHSQTFGGSGGLLHEVELDIDREEEFRDIRGTIGNADSSNNKVLTSLSFSTNFKKYGPFGCETQQDDSCFVVPLLSGSFVGFYGRSADFLNAIGFYIQQENEKIVIDSWGYRTSTNYFYDCIGKITKISIWYHKFISAIRFTSQADDGTIHTSPKYGGFNGTYAEVNIDIDMEELNCISGTVNTGYIASLSFSTSLNKFGPFGEIYGRDFSLPITKGKFGGFYGEAGAGLCSIGFYVHPA